jgi:hypothetical protein
MRGIATPRRELIFKLEKIGEEPEQLKNRQWRLFQIQPIPTLPV